MTGVFPFRYYPPKNRIRTSSKTAQIPTTANSPSAIATMQSTSFLKAYKKSQKEVGLPPSSQAIIAQVQLKQKRTTRRRRIEGSR